MTEDAIEIGNLLSKLHSGTTDDRSEALMGLAIMSESSLDKHLEEQMRTHLVPIVTGQVRTDLQSGCFAAIALAKMGDRSQDVAAPLVMFLQYYAEDPVKFSGPMDESLNSSNLLCFAVHVAYALSLFKGDGVVVSSLVDVIARCLDPKSGENRTRSETGVEGPQFYDIRIGNLVKSCLRSIGAIGESETEGGVKMLEWWDSRGNMTAKAALELFGNSWGEVVDRESALKKPKAVDTALKSEGENEVGEDDGKEEDLAARLSKVLNLCETDPDAGLELIELGTKGDTEAEGDPIWRWARAMAYGGKGLFKALRELGLTDEQLDDVSSWDAVDFRERLRLSDEHLDHLEAALREIRRIEATAPGFLATIGTDEERIGEAKVDLMAAALERCRPGKVQELMGTTKLFYFGSDRRRMGVRPGLDLSSADYAILWNPKFSAPLVVKAAISMDRGVDGKGRGFVTCLLYQKCFDEWEPDETLETASSAGVLYLFSDGSWHHGNDTGMVFIAGAMPGMSLPREFRQSPGIEAETHKSAQPDSGSKVSTERGAIRDEPKKEGFFRRLFG